MSKTAAKQSDETAVVTMAGGLPPELAEDLSQYAGAGVSERDQDFALPFLAIAQSNSPQVKKQQQDKYIPGLEVGDIFNTATGEYWRSDEGVVVVQSWFQKAMVEWILRDEGGGWVATHPIDMDLREAGAQWRGGENNKKFLLLPNGHQLVDTSYHFVTLAETGEAAVVSMVSTSLGCSRNWQTLLKRIKIPSGGSMVIAPCFARAFRLRTAYRKNDVGDWFVFTVADEGWAAGNQRYKVGYDFAKRHFLQAQEHGVQMGRPPEDAVSSDTDGPTVDASADAPI